MSGGLPVTHMMIMAKMMIMIMIKFLIMIMIRLKKMSVMIFMIVRR